MPWTKGSHKTPRDKFPTRRELKALFAAAPKVSKEFTIAMKLAYYFGLRCGEVRILRREHLSPEKGLLFAPTLKRARQKDRRRRLVDPALRPTKDLPTFALPCPATKDAQDTLMEAWEMSLKSPYGLAFDAPTDDARPRATGWFRLMFGRVRKLAKVRPGISFHSLRHAHGSAVAAGTKDPVFVRDRLRHSSVVTTNIYMHSTKKYQDEMGQALDLGGKS